MIARYADVFSSFNLEYAQEHKKGGVQEDLIKVYTLNIKLKLSF